MSFFKKTDDFTDSDIVSQIFEKRQAGKYDNLIKKAEFKKSYIEKEETEYNKEKISHKDSYDWDEANKPAFYEEIYKRAIKNTNSIQRITCDTFEETETVRSLDNAFKAFTPEDYANALMKGASIWNPDFAEIQEAFKESQKQYDRAEQLKARSIAESKMNRHNDWQESKIKSLRDDVTSNSRAHSITKVASEDASTSSRFGYLTEDDIDEMDNLRKKTKDSYLDRKNSIKRASKSSQDYRTDWENLDNCKARSLEEIYDFSKSFAEKFDLDL